MTPNKKENNYNFVTYNNLECLSYGYLLCSIVNVAALLVLPPFYFRMFEIFAKILFEYYNHLPQLSTEVESSTTSLASRTSSRTHFEVLGLGLEVLGPRKLPCPRLEESTIF